MNSLRYRIESNGICFVVKELRIKKFLWFRWAEWVPMKDRLKRDLFDDLPTYFSSVESATEFVTAVIRQHRNTHDWSLVKEFEYHPPDNSSASPGP